MLVKDDYFQEPPTGKVQYVDDGPLLTRYFGKELKVFQKGAIGTSFMQKF